MAGNVLTHLKFTPTRIDPDVYMRKNFNVHNQTYWEYPLVYDDDVLALSQDPEPLMKGIGRDLKPKQ